MITVRAEEPLPFAIDPMEMDDIAAVMEVERQSFTMPWPGNAYRRELKENRLARYIVARRTGPPLRAEGPDRTGVDRSRAPARPGGLRGFLDRLAGALGGTAEAPVEPGEKARRVVGYAGLWLMVDEAHVTSIAVSPPCRGLGVGELLFLGLIDISRAMGAQYVTLEVRVSNSLAQNLYRKYGFKETGARRKYYSDNNEDAMIMWSDPLDSSGFKDRVEQYRNDLMERLRSSRTVGELRTRGVQA